VTDPNFEALKKTCNMWRNWKDIEDSWESVTFTYDYFAKNQDRLAPHAGPGHWNDPDTLLLGNFGLSYDQSRAQLAIWSILAAPFILSTDLRTIKPEMKELILNREIIAVNQDKLGLQGRLIRTFEGVEVWSRKILPKVDGEFSYAIAFVVRFPYGFPFSFDVTLDFLQDLNNENGYIVQVSSKVD